MTLQSKREPDFDARWAASLARGAPHDRTLRHSLAFVPAAVAVAVGIYVAPAVTRRKA